MATPKFKAGPVPKEALDYLEKKGIKPSAGYKDVWGQEHNYAFTVAKIMENDVLYDVKASLEAALEEGVSFSDWVAQVQPMLDKSGWSNYGEEPQSLYRLRNIFQTNMRVASAAGQWDRIERNKKTHPALEYLLGPSKEHRVEHAEWAGLVIPVDDPWWDTHMPPNGYGCKCSVRQVSTAEAEEVGIDEPPDDGEETWVDEDGVGHVTPYGIDPGWDYNPGKDRARQLDDVEQDSEDDLDLLRQRGRKLLALMGEWRVSKNGNRYYYSYEPKGPKDSSPKTMDTLRAELKEPIKEWKAGLSAEEKDAVELWRANGYAELRTVDSGGEVGRDYPTATKKQDASGNWVNMTAGELAAEHERTAQYYTGVKQKQLAALKSAMEKAPVVEDTVYRGLGGLSDEKFSALTTVGKVVKDTAISSWTPDKDLARKFAVEFETTDKGTVGGKREGKKIVLELLGGSSSGRYIAAGGGKGQRGEVEAVLPKGVGMKVESVEHREDHTVVRVREVHK